MNLAVPNPFPNPPWSPRARPLPEPELRPCPDDGNETGSAIRAALVGAILGISVVVWRLAIDDPADSPGRSPPERLTPDAPGADPATVVPASGQGQSGHQRERAVPNSPSPSVRSGFPASEAHAGLVADFARAGLGLDEPVVLTAPERWSELERLWEQQSERVNAARSARRQLATKIARARLKAGEFEEILVGPEAIAADGSIDGPWRNLLHPDEWVTTRYRYREGGGQIVEQVRIMPGELPELDNATTTFRVAETLRRNRVRAFIAQHRIR